MPAHQACVCLNLTREELTNLCKTYNIKKWPYYNRKHSGESIANPAPNCLFSEFKMNKSEKTLQMDKRMSIAFIVNNEDISPIKIDYSELFT